MRFRDIPNEPNPKQPAELQRWRKLERERLIKERLALPSDIRRQYGEQIAEQLEQAIGIVSDLTVSAYWPFRGEPDLRGLLVRLAERGARTALPVVVSQGLPLVFRNWIPGEPLERGVWNIPVPPANAEIVQPNVVIAPLVGFDPNCYRLGYGGAFFDRTLAVLHTSPRVFGVGYSQTALPTIYPQHIPMDVIVTEDKMISHTWPA